MNRLIFLSFCAAFAFGVEAEENIPLQTEGSMPEDAVMDRMEKSVDSAAWSAYLKARPSPFLLFGEDRRYAVRNDIVPAHWLAKDCHASELFKGTAQPGEFYPFQVCVASESPRGLRWRAKTDLSVTCITPERCEVRANGVKPIWVMLDIPKDSAGKTFKGAVHVEDAESGESRELPFEIAVKGDVLKDGGVSDAWRLSRLKWLNSDIGRDETVTKPYAPVVVDGATRTIRLLGRELVLGEDGLPARIVSHFSGSNTRIEKNGFDLLAKPFALMAKGLGPSDGGSFAFTELKPTHASWRAETSFGAVKRIVEGRMDFTGSGFFRVRYMERSGVAFGIPGEMLGRGNPFRGLLFGMTDRWGWGGSPKGLWKFFDSVRLADKELIGWWDDDCPVKVIGSGDVKASVWKGSGDAVLVIANFTKKARKVSLSFDAAKLGFDGSKAKWLQPAISGVQKASGPLDVSAPVAVPAAGGLVLRAAPK